MKTKTLVSLIALLGLSGSFTSAAPVGTAFTYQGQLADAGSPANGSYDLTFTLYDDVSGGTAVAGPLTNAAIAVSNGLFTTSLDFGAGAFTGSARWLEISARTNGSGAFTALTPRQALTPAPYAIFASNAAVATTATSAISVASGAVGTAGLQNSAVDSSKIADGTISSSDLSLTLLNSTFWKLLGNAGTTAGVNFLGTTDEEPLELKVHGIRALRLEPKSQSPNIIGGFKDNFVGTDIQGATIGGGGANLMGTSYINAVTADFGTVSGGWGNTVFGKWSSIGGGEGNIISNANDATISGGSGNRAFAISSSIGGGTGNTIEADANNATIAGGLRNGIERFSYNSTIAGGTDNGISNYSASSVIGGGHHNVIHEQSGGATIAGGWDNTIHTNAVQATIGGGLLNVIQNTANESTIAGGRENTIQSAERATISGGEGNTIGTNASKATISGGSYNLIDKGTAHATIGGGLLNAIRSTRLGPATNSSIHGGFSNVVYVRNSVIGGGKANRISHANSEMLDSSHTIGGGEQNQIGYEINGATIGGGRNNFVDGGDATVAGGSYNTVAWAGSSTGNAIGGGSRNYIQAFLSATISGGYSNRVEGNYATIPGGASNRAAGAYSFAAGRRAKANHQGAFVWADSTDADFDSSANDEVAFRCNGGVRFSSGAGGGNQTVSWAPGSASWSFSSDRNLKEGVAAVDGKGVLDRVARLPISEWNYKGYAQRHIGPMAQDFQALFPLNESETTLNSADLDGVALAAIQGLNQKVEDRSLKLEERNAALEKQVAELKAQLKTLMEKVNGGGQ